MSNKEKRPLDINHLRAKVKDSQANIDAINLLMNETFAKISAVVQERIHLKKKMSKAQLFINKTNKLIEQIEKEQTEIEKL